MVVVACGCSCTLLLHLASTCPGGSSGANTPLAHVVVITCCNLCWWCFSFQPLAQILHLHSCNLHCVVVVACGGVFFICGGIYVVYKCNYILRLQLALCTLAVSITCLIHAYSIRASACVVHIS